MLWDSIVVDRGVKQGDPCTMLLFIIAYDPLIKFISSSLGPRAISHVAYCDDLAIASTDLCGAWMQLVRLFRIIKMIRLLEMNAKNTILCHL